MNTYVFPRSQPICKACAKMCFVERPPCKTCEHLRPFKGTPCKTGGLHMTSLHLPLHLHHSPHVFPLAVDFKIRCQKYFGGGFELWNTSLWRWIARSAAKSAAKGNLAVDPSFWRWIAPFGGGFGGGFLPLTVDLAVDFPFGGGSKNPLPKVGGEGPLGKDELG